VGGEATGFVLRGAGRDGCGGLLSLLFLLALTLGKALEEVVREVKTEFAAGLLVRGLLTGNRHVPWLGGLLGRLLGSLLGVLLGGCGLRGGLRGSLLGAVADGDGDVNL
jgi:hypothetical protein